MNPQETVEDEMKQNIVYMYMAPEDLAVHFRAKSMPEWDSEDDRFLALVADIQERGIDQPILVDQKNRILDGRHRWRAAKRLQLDQVPVVIRDEHEVASIILGTLLQRRHYTQGALAYLAWPLCEDAVKESKQRQAANLKKGNLPRGHSVPSRETLENFADSLGIGRRLLVQAKQVHDLFLKADNAIDSWQLNPTEEKPVNLRAEFEPRILSGEIGLGACIAGIAGMDSTKGQPKVTGSQLELFSDVFTTLQKRMTYWSKMAPQERTAAVPFIRQAVYSMPADLRQELAKAIKAAEKQEAA